MIAANADNLPEDYLHAVKGRDEILDANGRPKPHWLSLFSVLREMGPAETDRRRQEVSRALREKGIIYSACGSPGTTGPSRELDVLPYILGKQEWDTLSAGLIQRAILLDLMIRDIYGPRLLLRDGILPAGLIFSNTGFYRPCFDTGLPGANQLIFCSADMARGPDGRMRILDSQTQIPSGAAYALENRDVLSAVLPELGAGTPVLPLTPFFNSWQNTLLSFSKKDNPGIVLLTPGPDCGNYFEQAYLASYLGYTLAQGEDLLVRNGYVWLKTLEGLQKVDIILRRVDDGRIDPLELKEDSRTGVPGLLHAVRSGKVAMINPPGTGVVENRAFAAYMPAICRHFLGEDLLLPSVPTWWCGDPRGLSHVLDHLDRLVIKKAAGEQAFLPGSGETEQLRKIILADPGSYVAQEEAGFVTTPCFAEGRLRPQPVSLRSFLANTGTGYRVMPGGLSSIVTPGSGSASSGPGAGIYKDTWIIPDEPRRSREKITLPAARDSSSPQNFLPSRSAENLFWAGRYLERTLSVTSLLGRTLHELDLCPHKENTPENGHIRVLLQSLTHLTQTYPGFLEQDNTLLFRDPYPKLLLLAANDREPGTVASGLSLFLKSAGAVRDKWAPESWRLINHLEDSLENILRCNVENGAPEAGGRRIAGILEKLRSNIFMFYGLRVETMSRNTGYLLFETGKSIEKCLSRISVLRSAFSMKRDREAEYRLIEIMLLSQHVMEEYRFSHKSGLDLSHMLEIMLLESTFPNSLAYQTGRLAAYLDRLPNAAQQEPVQKAMRQALFQIGQADIRRLTEIVPETGLLPNLDKFLSDLYRDISSVAAALTGLYFSHAVIRHSFLRETGDQNP